MGPNYAILYLTYITLVVFAIIRIITALFLKDTLATAANDMELQLDDHRRKRLRLEDKLLELFEHADESGDGRVSLEEFEKVFKDSNVKAWCSLIDIEIREIHDLFDLLDDGDGIITYHEFVNNMARLKGSASSQDVVAILHDCHQILVCCESLRGMMHQFTGVCQGSSFAGEGAERANMQVCA